MNSLSINLNDKTIIPKFIFGAAALVLAIDPVLWLVQTWRDPSYDSSGFIVFCVCAGIFLWSITSDRLSHKVNLGLPLFLLTVSSLTRLVGQVFAINVIGAITLVLDVYAIGHRMVGCMFRFFPSLGADHTANHRLWSSIRFCRWRLPRIGEHL